MGVNTLTCREVTIFRLPDTRVKISMERDKAELKTPMSEIYTWSGKEGRPAGIAGWLGSSWSSPNAGNDTSAGTSSKRH